MPFVLISILTGYHSRSTTYCLQQFTSPIVPAKTFESNSDNLSDHMPIKMAIKYTDTCHKQGVSSEEQSGRSKIYWSDNSCDEIYNKYVQPLLLDFEKVSDSSPLMHQFQARTFPRATLGVLHLFSARVRGIRTI